jgi:type VI secretion system protein
VCDDRLYALGGACRRRIRHDGKGGRWPGWLLARFSVAALLLWAAIGCTHTQHVKVTISTDANNNSPVIFSVVLPRNQGAMKKLLDLTAKQWFAQREQLLRDYRGDITETYYEFVPGQSVPELTQKVGRSVHQGILFVNYQTAGAHRYTFDANAPLKVSFGQRSVSFGP